MSGRLIYRKASSQTPAGSFRQAKFTRVTSFGSSYLAAISPDGQYVVHVRDESSKQSLWMRQTNETHDIEIVPAAEVRFQGLSVSPDSRRVFYTVWDVNKTDSTLYEVPLLGGTPQRLPVDINSAVTFSPDGKKIAFLHSAASVGDSRLIVTNVNGSEERILAKRQSPDTFETFYGAPAWSPDGKSIVATGASMRLGVKSRLLFLMLRMVLKNL